MAVFYSQISPEKRDRTLESMPDQLEESEDGQQPGKKLKLDVSEVPEEDSSSEMSTSDIDLNTTSLNDKINALGNAEKVASKNTHKSTKWSIETFRLWIAQRNARGAQKVPDDLLENPPEPCVLSEWLSVFITEVRSRDGKLYPPKTICLLLCGIQRYMRNINPSCPSFLVASRQSDFAKLHRTMESLFRQLRMQGIGLESKASEPLTSEDEKQLWSSGVLNPGNPLGLLRAVYYCNEKNLLLGSGHCHRRLRLSQFKRQTNPDCYMFVKISTKPQTKNQLIPIYANPVAGTSCHVFLLDNYLSKLPAQAFENDDFYLTPLPKTPLDLLKPWYSTSPVGKNHLQKMIGSMCAEAGIPGHKTNHSLRVAGALRSRRSGLSSIQLSPSTNSESFNSRQQGDNETLSIAPAVMSTTVQPMLGPAHGPTHLSVVDQLSAIQNGLDDEVVAVSNMQSNGKKNSPSASPTSSSRDISPHHAGTKNPPARSSSTSDSVEPYESEPLFAQTNRQAVGQPLLNILETHPRDISTLGSYDIIPNPMLGELRTGVEPSNSQSDSQAFSPSVQSVGSTAENSNLSNLPLFMAPVDSQMANETTSLVLAMSSPKQPEKEETSESVMHSQNSNGNLQEALILLARGKEETETTIHELQQKLEEQKLRCVELERELVIAQTEVQQVRESHIQQQQTLERENVLLREQLRRYVAMVQSHQHQQHPTSTSQESEDSKTQKSNLQKKLSAMAEMYGELMEFNDRLHKQVNNKDAIIIKLGQTITLARIEMPVPTSHLPPEALQPRKLVEVWIPSVIKKGCGPDTHHAYQVYVKLGGNEWNVYRSFAEFYEFHCQISLHIPEVAEFNFPPKKAINDKSPQVVEERRQRLQEYLQVVLEVCSKPTAKRNWNKSHFKPVIPVTVTKETFLQTFPFFRDITTVQQNVAPKNNQSHSGW